MGALPRPDVPAGPHRDLVDALHDLHHRAGWPSLRVMAAEVGCSHTTVSKAFSSPKVPSWGLLELLVDALGGSREEFRSRWLAVTGSEASTGARRLVGRTAELRRVGEHLARGAGVLLVMGEAGVGKSCVVGAASAVGRGSGLTVLTGWCRAISGDVPLLPVVDWLRTAYALDDGRTLVAAIADSPPFVADTLGRLLPELRPDSTDNPDGSRDRSVLFAAIGHGLTALARARPLALILEDAHWADAATLELVDFLVVRESVPPTVITWRSEDPHQSRRASEWLASLRRLPHVEILQLSPLDFGATTDQLRMLGVHAPDTVHGIWKRSLGNPLFTEQLAAQHAASPATDPPGATGALPAVLVDVLERALVGVSPGAISVAQVLAVADRSLGNSVLATATGLDDAALAEGIRELVERRAVWPQAAEQVSLRHPLFVDAIRRTMTPVDLSAAHRRLAAAMGGAGTQPAAEVAEHWRQADRFNEELVWRVRAARDAQARFAYPEAASQWLRALEIWPPTETLAVDGVRRLDAYLSGIAVLAPFDLGRATRVATDAIASFPDVTGHDAAELLQTAADPIGRGGDPEAAIVLLDRAIAIYDDEEPCTGLVKALIARDVMTWGLNRFEEGEADCARGLEISAGLDDVALHREMLALQGQHDAIAGHLELAYERLHQANVLRTLGPDPNIDVLTALFLTNVLLMSHADADAVVEAGRLGVEATRDWGLQTHWSAILHSNISEALRREGRVEEACTLVAPLTEGPASMDDAVLHVERAALDLMLGRGEAAARRISPVKDFYYVDLEQRLGVAVQAAIIDVWCGRCERAFAELVSCLEVAAPDPSVEIGEAIGLAARAAADLVIARPTKPHADAYAARLDAILARAAADPFEPHPVIAARAAWGASWRAERRRLARRPGLDAWLAAAGEWDQVRRPLDAAYCRWRAAEAAITDGRGALASTLLARAAREAREHRPLQAAIAATAVR